MTDRRIRPLLGVALLATATPLAAQAHMELPARDRILEPALEKVFAVGTFDGAEWETFGEVAQVGFDRAGNLYVFDRQNSRVVVVDRRGEFVREFGKKGEGPGEWRFPGGMGVLPDGSVVISDAGHRAFLLHGPDGAFLRSISMGEGSTVSLGALLPDPTGGAVFNAPGAGFSMRMSVGGGAAEVPRGRPIERITLGEGGEKTVFFRAWGPEPADAPRIRSSSSGGGFALSAAAGPRTFEPRLHLAVLPDGSVALVDSSAYEVKIVDAAGRLTGLVSRDIRPVKVTRRIQEAEKKRQVKQLEAGEGPRMAVMIRGSDGRTQSLGDDQIREMQMEQIENRGFWPEIPVVARLSGSPAGTLWLERSKVNPEENGPIDLFRADATYLGTLAEDGPRVPAAFGPDGLVAYVERDEMDVPTVTVWRLPAEIR